MCQLGSVYVIKNNINNKIYIGQTIQKLSRRIARHKNMAFSKKDNKPLYCAFRKHGFENFSIKSFDGLTRDEMDELEIFLIEDLQTRKRSNGYNICLGGKSRKGFKHTEEAKRKIGIESANRERKTGYFLDEEHRKNISKANTGRKVSEETKLKISISGKNYYDKNPDARLKVSKRMLGEKNSASIFTDDFIFNLKKEFKETGMSKKDISEKYNMCYSTCANILNGYKWSHIKVY